MLTTNKDRTLVIDGRDVANGYDMVLTEKSLPSPAARTSYVSVPARDGDIDLTDALLGRAAYENVEQKFRFVYAVGDQLSESRLRREILGLWHGKRLRYRLGWEPDYTYTGRFDVQFSTDGNGRVGVMDVTVVADPWRRRAPRSLVVNANGGIVVSVESGTMPVCPTFTCTNPTEVEFDGFHAMLPQGTYRCPDIVFTRGWNTIYLNSWHVRKTLWGELAEDGGKALTWGEAKSVRWFELQQVGEGLDTMRAATWEDLRWRRWGELADKPWSTVSYVSVANEGLTPRNYKTTVQYDWADL